MGGTRLFEAGGYRFIPGPFQYSSGVAAGDGQRIVRVRFATPVRLMPGFAAIKSFLEGRGLAPTAFCACELRSPQPFTDGGFTAFNRDYVKTLAAWGILDGETNPVARSNVCPLADGPPEPSFHAFSFVEPVHGARPSFVIAGGAEARPGSEPYDKRIVRLGETSADALMEKARFVLDAMEARMAAFGHGWAQTTGVHIYSVHDIHPIATGEIAQRGVGRHGLDWHLARPPVIGLEYEMDCRGVEVELVIPASGALG